MPTERRKGERVIFERGIAAHMMGIDGTWRRECMMEDISETGAKLSVEGSVEGLPLKEFFLLLSSTGLAYRRCELVWVNGHQLGVMFQKQGDKKKQKKNSLLKSKKPIPEKIPPDMNRAKFLNTTIRPPISVGLCKRLCDYKRPARSVLSANLIGKGDAFRIVRLEPSIGRSLFGEHPYVRI